MWVQKVGGGGVEHVAFAPDGRTLYTCDRGGWVTAWDVAARTHDRLFQLDHAERCNTRPIFFVDGGRYLVVPTYGYARVWDVKRTAPLPNVPRYTVYGDMHPAPSGPAIRFARKDGEGIDGYDVLTGEQSRVLDAPPE